MVLGRRHSSLLHAFEESGVWPPNCKQTLKCMRIFIKKQDKTNPPPNDDDDLPLLPSTLKTYYQSECSMAEWEEYVPDILSSPSARRFKSWAKGTKINLARAELQSIELSQLQAKFDEQN